MSGGDVTALQGLQNIMIRLPRPPARATSDDPPGSRTSGRKANTKANVINAVRNKLITLHGVRKGKRLY